MSYLLDTNVCIALINATSNRVRTRFIQAARRKALLATSSIVAHELWYGVARSQLVADTARAVKETAQATTAIMRLNGAAGGNDSVAPPLLPDPTVVLVPDPPCTSAEGIVTE